MCSPNIEHFVPGTLVDPCGQRIVAAGNERHKVVKLGRIRTAVKLPNGNLAYHSVSKVLGMRAPSAQRLMKQPTPCPPPVRFRYQSTPGGNMSQHVPPYGHKVGFVCMGGTPSAAWLAQTPKLGGTPYTYKTNPVVIRGNMWAYITPRGRLIPKPHPGGGAGGRLFHKPLWR